MQNVNRRFEALVESVPLFRDYINEEEEIIKQLGILKLFQIFFLIF